MAVIQRRRIPELNQSDIARFWSLIDIRDADGCWLWTKAVNVGGYGRFAIKAICYPAHRVAFLIANGRDADPALSVLHRCDTPRCCNPRHLWEGTLLENNRDREQKGRGCNGDKHWTRHAAVDMICPPNHPFRKSELKQGELHPRAKLTTTDVLEIRRLFSAGEATTSEIAKRYPISRSQVYFVVRRKSWAHI